MSATSRRTRLGSAALLGALALFSLGSSAQPTESRSSAAKDSPAYRLDAGSVAKNRVVVVGRDLVIDGEAQSHVVAVSGAADVSGVVAGDLIVLGGDVRLADGARIRGDVFVLGGRIESSPGATVEGRSVAYPDIAAPWLTLIEGPSLGLAAGAPLVLGAKLALLAFWSLMVVLFFAISGREVLSTSESVRLEPFRNFAVGLTGILAMVLTAMFFNAFSGALLGVPLVVLVLVVALVLRFWGMVAVFHALGTWLSTRLGRRPPLPLHAACYGLLALGAIKFLPWLGVWTWTLATFIGVGAALSTKLGRREPWFQPV